MSTGRIVGFCGSFSTPSKTRILVDALAAQIATRTALPARVFDIGDLGPTFGRALPHANIDDATRFVIDEIVSSDVLVVGSPTYKGGYSGLFKHLFDLLDPLALMGKPVALAATGGSERHALVIEHQLRPLFGFFATHTAPTGVFATDRDFEAGRIVSPQVAARIEQAANEIERLLPQPRAKLLAAE